MMNEIHDIERCTDDAHGNAKNNHEPRLHLLSNDSLLLLGGPNTHSPLSLLHQVHPTGNGKHDQRAEQGAVQTDDHLHLRHQNRHRHGGEQDARRGAMINAPDHAYRKRSESAWNSRREQKREWRLVLTAK